MPGRQATVEVVKVYPLIGPDVNGSSIGTHNWGAARLADAKGEGAESRERSRGQALFFVEARLLIGNSTILVLLFRPLGDEGRSLNAFCVFTAGCQKLRGVRRACSHKRDEHESAHQVF